MPTVLNEILASTAGTDSEYVELSGDPGAPLAGLSVIGVLLEGDRRGDVQFRFDFGDDAVLGENGFYLVGNDIAAQTYGVTPDAVIGSNALQNASTTFALVETATLAGDAVTGGEVVRDSVSSVEDAAVAGLFGSPVLGPDGRFLPAGVGRIADGVDTDAASDFRILSFGNDPTVNTPTAATGGDAGGGDDGSIDDAPTLISAIQGTDDEAALVGETVVVEGIVTGDFQSGDADGFRDLGGFFLMEEDADRDDDDATSEGIFAYEGGGDTALDVDDGDRVRVLGTVVERFGKTTVEVSEVRIEEAAAADPLSLAVETALPDAEDREALESMLVTVAEPLTFTESFDYEDFNTATLSADGPVYQFTQRNAPDAAGNAAYGEAVEDRLILIDDGSDGRRDDFDPIPAPDGSLVTDPAQFRMGQSVDDLTAIFDYGFGAFRLRLPEGVAFDLDESTNPVPDAPIEVGSDYRVASFNVLNYFTTLDDGTGPTAIGADPRGADSAEELARQEAKIVEAILQLDADVIGLVEIENEFSGDSFALRTLVDAINTEAGAERYAFVDPGRQFVGDDAIAVAFVYDQTTTAAVGEAAILDTPAFLDPLGAETDGDSFNRAALAQSFEEIASNGVFTASINHFKSKGSLTGAPADEDQGDGAGRNDATRTEAARELAEWLATDPTGVDDPDVMILGDLNAYAREAPITTLEDVGYTDLARSFEGDDVYSYRFSGQIGTLDYALANESLLSQVTGAETVHTNADTPVIFDYNLDDTFTGPNILRPTDQGLYAETPLRASDHDPVVVGLDLAPDAVDPIVIAGTDGNDRLNGTEADETLVAGGGRVDVLRGGGGADAFVFTDTEGARDGLRILDYEVGADVVDLAGAEVAGTRAIGGTLRIELAEDRDVIYVKGVTDVEQITFAGNDTPFV